MKGDAVRQWVGSVVLAMVLGGGVPGVSGAQSSIEAGAWDRSKTSSDSVDWIAAPSERDEQEVRDESLPDGQDLLKAPFTTARDAAVADDDSANVWKGALIGAGVGFVVGTLAVGADFWPPTGLGFALIGALIGMGVASAL